MSICENISQAAFLQSKAKKQISKDKLQDALLDFFFIHINSIFKY